MDNAELERRLLENEGTAETAEETRIETAGYLVFHLDGSRYALPTGMVREVVVDSPTYFVPFVPPYVRGLINRHGEPYTSLDLAMFLSQQRIEAATHLVLSVPGDQIALLVTDVVEIVKVAISDIREIASSQGEAGWFSGSFTFGENEVWILDAESILARLGNDVGRE